ncbi:hypothetical protein GQX74_007397 [Glossina fuscipes]|nr:hypothetical protein GQX74_007397 [Glossina fuscipes]
MSVCWRDIVSFGTACLGDDGLLEVSSCATLIVSFGTTAAVSLLLEVFIVIFGIFSLISFTGDSLPSSGISSDLVFIVNLALEQSSIASLQIGKHVLIVSLGIVPTHAPIAALLLAVFSEFSFSAGMLWTPAAHVLPLVKHLLFKQLMAGEDKDNEFEDDEQDVVLEAGTMEVCDVPCSSFTAALIVNLGTICGSWLCFLQTISSSAEEEHSSDEPVTSGVLMVGCECEPCRALEDVPASDLATNAFKACSEVEGITSSELTASEEYATAS